MKTVRCAVYTRKSTEEGLEQVFNTLHAQREACEAYVKSQAGEGWELLRTPYDDGGFSGGNMDRPAIKRLLAEVDAGKVDVIVVYKVDRLTRSLMDFSRIVERLDARGVSFVSVTQAFNTTTSMGRLTLNVLLSFAQFEREVTGERIRDKIAASKARGMWMGGNVPLGYDLRERQLVINTEEAERVQYIFRRFVELGSGVKLARELQLAGVISKRWISRSGQERGGLPLSCGALYYLLQNRLYRGEIVHRDVRHAGQHGSIISEELFEQVQQLLASNRRNRRKWATRTAECHLAGLVYTGEGQQLTTSFSYGRGGRTYRYYVSRELTPAGALKGSHSTGLRVAAAPLEKLVIGALGQLLGRDLAWSEGVELVQRIECREASVQLVLRAERILEPCEPIFSALDRLQRRLEDARLAQDHHGCLRLIVDRRPSFRGGSKGARPTLHSASGGLSLLRQAHGLLADHSMSPLEPGAHSDAHAPPSQRQRHLMHFGLLSPQLQRRIVESEGCSGHAVSDVGSIPLAWADQR